MADARNVVVGLNIFLDGLTAVRNALLAWKSRSNLGIPSAGGFGGDDDEVDIFTYLEPFLSLSYITRRVSGFLMHSTIV